MYNMRERQVREWQVKNESVETQDRDNVFTLRVFPGDASTPPPLLDPALQSLASGSPLSRTDLTGGSTLLLSCQTQPHVAQFHARVPGAHVAQFHARVPGAKSRHDLLVNTLCVVGAPATVNKRNTMLIKHRLSLCIQFHRIELFVVSVYAAPGGGRNEAKPMDDATRERYREAAKEMFYHSYDSYLQHAFPPHRVRKGPVNSGPVREQT